MNEVRVMLKPCFEMGKTVPCTCSSHHFLPLSKYTISHKFTSEDEEYMTFHFDVFEKSNKIDLQISTYIGCVYNKFWWIGFVLDINEECGDIKVEKHFTGLHLKILVMCHPFEKVLCTIKLPSTTT